MSSSRSTRSRTARRRPASTARERVPRGHKMAVAPIAAGRAGAQVRPDHRLCVASRSRPATGCTSTTSRCTISRATIASPRARRNDEMLPPELRATFEGYRAAERQDRHAQLYRHPHLGELLGHRSARFIAERSNRSGMLDDYPRDRRRRAVRARHRLRHGRQGRGLRRAAAHAMGLRDAIPISAAR